MILLTCVPERNHHDKAEDDVDSETAGHLNIGHPLSLLVFPDGESSLVPVLKRRGEIETEEKMEELVQEVFSADECLGGEQFYQEYHEELCQ